MIFILYIIIDIYISPFNLKNEILSSMEYLRFDEVKYNDLIESIADQIISKCKLNLSIPNSLNLHFTIDEDKLKDLLIEYLYETSNN